MTNYDRRSPISDWLVTSQTLIWSTEGWRFEKLSTVGGHLSSSLRSQVLGSTFGCHPSRFLIGRRPPDGWKPRTGDRRSKKMERDGDAVRCSKNNRMIIWPKVNLELEAILLREYVKGFQLPGIMLTASPSFLIFDRHQPTGHSDWPKVRPVGWGRRYDLRSQERRRPRTLDGWMTEGHESWVLSSFFWPSVTNQ